MTTSQADVVHDLFAETVFGDSPLGRPVLGSVESIEMLSRCRPLPATTVVAGRPGARVAAAGNVDHATVVGRCARPSSRPVRWHHGRAPGAGPACTAVSFVSLASRTGLGRPAPPSKPISSSAVGVARTDDRRFALGVYRAPGGA